MSEHQHQHAIELASGRLVQTTAEECPECLNAKIAALTAALAQAREACNSALTWLKRVQVERPQLYWAIMRETGMMFPQVELEAIDAAREVGK